MSTSIEELTQGQNTQGPITQNPNNEALTPSVVNQLLNDINEASMKGGTQLSSRDIPMQSEIDEQCRPNYLPEEGEQYIKPEKHKPKVDLEIYDEIQMPILLAIIYFLFQLPVFRNFMFQMFPFMFSKDGNSNIQGYFGFSIMFGIFYYVISKAMLYMNF